MRQITFSLNDKDFKKIEELAEEERRSKSSFIRNIVFKKLEIEGLRKENDTAK